jgi:ABC-2 type transport system permease protein
MSMALVYVMIIVLFMGIMITGQLIATEITAEKNSRVMEVLVTSVAPLTQMFGKIFGMFLVGTFQIVFFILVVVINLNLPHNIDLLSSMDLSLSDIDPMVLIAAIFFYLTGYFLYATLYAAIGSIVSRTEELGQAVTPLMFLSMAGFYIGIFSIGTPDSALVKITSFIPFFTPFIMFLRIGLTEPAWWEVGLAIAGLFLSILFFGWLSAKIYRTGVLMYGKRPGWKELRKAMKAYKI